MHTLKLHHLFMGNSLKKLVVLLEQDHQDFINCHNKKINRVEVFQHIEKYMKNLAGKYHAKELHHYHINFNYVMYHYNIIYK